MTEPERDELRRHAVERLLEIKRAGRDLPSELVRRAGADAGVSERTMWRWVAQGSSERKARGRYVLPELAKTLYFQHHGNVAAVHRQLVAEGMRPPTAKTLREAFQRELTPDERAFAVDGEEGRRRFTLYRRVEAEARNDLWEADHKEMPVQAVPPRGRHPQKVWLTVFLDAYSRAVMGWAVSLQPSAATVLAALEMAVLVNEERGPFGGVPTILRWDNGLDWLADSVSEAATRMGSMATGTSAYSPHQKGKVERFFRTVDQELLSGMPFYTEGARAANSELYGPEALPMDLDALVSEVEAYVNHYNLERGHSSLDGQSPLERWSADATPISPRSREQLRWLLLPRTDRKVLKDGIHFEKQIYIAPELDGIVGERVEVRFMPHDLREIEIWHEGRFLAFAVPQEALGEEGWKQVMARRRSAAKRAGQMRRRASRRARAKLTPITGPGVGGEEGTVVSREEAWGESETRSDEGIREQARLDLLGIEEVNRPLRGRDRVEG